MSNTRPRRINVNKIDLVEPLDDYVIIEVHDAEAVSKGGIVIPDKAKKKTFQGTVIAVGPGKVDNNGNRTVIDVEVGDVLIWRNFMGWEMVEIEGRSYYAISSEERLAKIPKAKVAYE